jgi:uncharacterized membrane protein
VENTPNDLQALRSVVRDLAQRVERLERKLGLIVDAAPSSTLPAPVHRETSSAANVATAPAPKPAPVTTNRAQSETLDTDLESRIGSHWLNRIGIAAVLVGVSYFLKLAFDNNWIGPAGRVVIGLIAGIGVLAWSERFRRHGYLMFSYSLKAVGVSVLYLSLWAAFHVYNLIPVFVAFFAMLAVTAGVTMLAIFQDTEILAAFALIGGFATPILLSTGQNHEIQLFSYLMLLDGATLTMVIYKPWRRLALLSFLGTLTLYIGWYSTFYNRSQITPTLTFATLFFAIFAVAPLIVRKPESETYLATMIPLLLAFANAVTYFLQVYAIFEEIDKHITAWFAVGLALLYLVLSLRKEDYFPDPKNAWRLGVLHLAIALGLITVAIPIRLDGHWITIGWLVESFLLLRVGARVRSDFVSAFAVGALILGVLRLIVTVDEFTVTTVIFNARFATFIVAIAVLGATASYGIRRGDSIGLRGAGAAIIALNVMALFALSLEVGDYFTRARRTLSTTWQPLARHPGSNAEQRLLSIEENFAYSALWMTYGAMLMVVGFWRRSAFVRWQALVLIAFTIAKVFLFDVSELDRVYRIASFIVLGILLLAISFAYQRDWLQLSRGQSKSETRKS